MAKSIPPHLGVYWGYSLRKGWQSRRFDDVAIRNAKPGAKAIKLADGGGMFLLVTPAGGKLWRLKYRVDGREKLLAIGAYPEIGLGEARRRREEARELIALGKDPAREKQRENVRARIQAADTFKAICDEYCEKRRRDGAKGHSQRISAALKVRQRPVAAHLLDGDLGGHPPTR